MRSARACDRPGHALGQGMITPGGMIRGIWIMLSNRATGLTRKSSVRRICVDQGKHMGQGSRPAGYATVAASSE